MQGPRISVAVLRGGPSSEYDVSLKSGDAVLRHLHPVKYASRDILIDKEGIWHIGGSPRMPENALKGIDVVVNALHGEYGEDGRVQRILEHLSVPYTGSDVLGSALAMNKALAKKRLLWEGVKMPRHTLIREERGVLDTQIAEAFRMIQLPLVIKPVSRGSSVGVSIVRNYHDLKSAVERAFEYSPVVLIEEFIEGREATCGVLENFRGWELYPLLPVEIRPPEGKDFFDYDAKYSGKSRELCPGEFTPNEMNTLQQLAALAHRALGLRHYSRSDFIVSPKRGVYFLETNTLPGLTSESLLPKSLTASSCSMPEFLDHIIDQALQR